jgi:hypothetical protein
MTILWRVYMRKRWDEIRNKDKRKKEQYERGRKKGEGRKRKKEGNKKGEK